jgi:hypothetical protein
MAKKGFLKKWRQISLAFEKAIQGNWLIHNLHLPLIRVDF